MSFIVKAWLDTIFPPLCVICKAKSDVKCFCLPCWTQCVPPDPEERCPHCFQESEGLCKECKIKPRLPFLQAAIFDSNATTHYLACQRDDLLADFAILQWVKLDWPLPDAIVPMVSATDLAKRFSERVDRPFAPLLKQGRCDVEAIEEDQILLLINHQSSFKEVDASISLLQETFPKKGFLLSVFPI